MSWCNLCYDNFHSIFSKFFKSAFLLCKSLTYIVLILAEPIVFYQCCIVGPTMPASQVPSIFSTPFKDLPNPRRVWVGTPGSREEGLGKLSLLTPEVVRAAAVEEVQTGIRITLSWSLDKLELPNLNRQPCKHDIIPLLGGEAYDDVYHMNPRKHIFSRLLAFAPCPVCSSFMPYLEFRLYASILALEILRDGRTK